MFFFKDSAQMTANMKARFARVLASLGSVAILLPLGSCSPPQPTETWLDLVEESALAEVQQETERIDLGTSEARPSMGDGWSWDETSKDGTTFVWGVGPKSELDVYVSTARFLTFEARCLAFRFKGAEAQEVSVAWDGHELGRTVLGAGFTELRFKVPEELVTPGRRRITFTPTYTREVGAVAAGGDTRRLSFACDAVSLEGLASVDDAPRGEGRSLWLPGATELSFFIEAPDDVGGSQPLFLEWDGLERRPGTGFEVLWQTDTVATQVLFSVPASSDVVTGASGRVELPVAEMVGESARLALRATVSGDAKRSGLRFSAPRLTRVAVPEAAEPPVARAEPISPETSGSVAPPPILLWVVDTLRADRLGIYGHGRPVSPHFDRQAAESVIFDYAVAASSWTRPTAATLLTGVGPERHGIAGVDDRLDDGFVTLAEHLQAAGYATLGYSANGNVSAETGFAQGFERFAYNVVDVDDLWRLAEEDLDRLAAEQDSRPVFLMIHSVEPHAAFAPQEPFRSRFAPDETDPWFGSNEHVRALGDKKAPRTDDVVERLFNLYDAEIAWNDHVFGQALSAFESRGMAPWVVVVADHGEAFRERGVFGHGWDLHREVLHVPFWIHRPGTPPRRIAAPVQQADLLPTVLDLLGLPPAKDLEGQSLRPWIDGSASPPDPRPLISSMDYEGRSGASLVRGRFKLIEPRSADFASGRLLFDRIEDPSELHNLALERPVTAGRLARLLSGYLSRVDRVEAAQVELDEEARRQLEALGYL